MNKEYLMRCIDRLKVYADRISGKCPVTAVQMWSATESIRKEIGNCGWHLRDQGDKINGRRYLCRFVWEGNPDYPVYMVLTWNGVCEVPHFDNETDGVMRVTHWAEIDVPEGERA